AALASSLMMLPSNDRLEPVIVNIDENFVAVFGRAAPHITLVEGDEIKRLLRQAVPAEGKRFRIEKIAVDPLYPAALAANVPGRAQVAGPVLEFHFHPVAGFESNGALAHGSPHWRSNLASFSSISSLLRIFFSIRIASMLAIQRS